MNKPTGAVALVPKTKPGNSGGVVRYLKWPRFRKKSDYRKLHSGYRRRWRKIDPEVVFSIVVYANIQGIFSSRAIYRRSVQNRHQVYVAAANMT